MSNAKIRSPTCRARLVFGRPLIIWEVTHFINQCVRLTFERVCILFATVSLLNDDSHFSFERLFYPFRDSRVTFVRELSQALVNK